VSPRKQPAVIFCLSQMLQMRTDPQWSLPTTPWIQRSLTPCGWWPPAASQAALSLRPLFLFPAICVS
jgi:hypothetical protein